MQGLHARHPTKPGGIVCSTKCGDVCVLCSVGGVVLLCILWGGVWYELRSAAGQVHSVCPWRPRGSDALDFCREAVGVNQKDEGREDDEHELCRDDPPKEGYPQPTNERGVDTRPRWPPEV